MKAITGSVFIVAQEQLEKQVAGDGYQCDSCKRCEPVQDMVFPDTGRWVCLSCFSGAAK